jgi:hypothetical protein
MKSRKCMVNGMVILSRSWTGLLWPVYLLFSRFIRFHSAPCLCLLLLAEYEHWVSGWYLYLTCTNLVISPNMRWPESPFHRLATSPLISENKCYINETIVSKIELKRSIRILAFCPDSEFSWISYLPQEKEASCNFGLILYNLDSLYKDVESDAKRTGEWSRWVWFQKNSPVLFLDLIVD